MTQEEKINIAELLKGCPKGMELDCTICNNVVTLEGVDTVGYYPIRVMSKDGFHHILTPEGCVYKREDAKCVIFPKGKTTWEGFHKPFEDGDIVAFDAHHLQIFIFKDKKEDNTLSNCYLMLDVEDDELYLEDGMYYVTRFATEEERKILFDAIKANGYKWNANTKTLEKLVEPKFKDGDRVVKKGDISTPVSIVRVGDKYYYHYSNTEGTIGLLSIAEQDDWELVFNKFNITTFKPFDKVLMRSSNAREWVATFYSHYSNNKFYGCGMCCDQCIPYEKNEHLLGTTDDCDEYFKTWEE